MEHLLEPHLLNHAIRIHVIGAGGTGSALLPHLARIHRTLLALGREHGLEVTVWDADAVSAHNCVRSGFFAPDVGANKAEIMVYRLNVAHADTNLNWISVPHQFSADNFGYQSADVIIGCVDTKAARREIEKVVQNQHRCYWIDSGNMAAQAQVICGLGGKSVKGNPLRLPLVSELFPEIVSGEDDNTPSCSAVESIMRQGVLTNPMCAAWAASWLDTLLRFGKVSWCGVFFNLESGKSSSIPVDPVAWERIGYRLPIAA